MKSIKMTEDRYWDTTGLYDSTLKKTQREVNAAQASATAAKYTKPSEGIPKTDLASGVQASLDKADSAIQQHQSLAAYRTAAAQDAIDAAQDAAIAGKYTKPGTGIPESDLASDVQSKIDNALPKTGDGSNVTAAFTAAANRTNISTGEKLSVIFGKIAKWFADLGSAAFRAATGSITQGSTDLVESGAVYTGLSGKYAKPASGIPASDLAAAVQSSLNNADSAVEYTAQTLTAAQQSQARSNIGAAGASSVLPIADNAGFHNSVYRGKNLGTAVTAEQWAAISAGTFDDLYIGDYWVINGITWRIAACDYWYGSGDTPCTTHHLAIMPDSCLKKPQQSSTRFIHTTNITTGAYVGTDYFSGANTAKADCTNIVQSAFGASHILAHREFFANSVSSGGDQNSGAYYDSTVELPSETMVFGILIFGSIAKGTTVTVNAAQPQLPLFRFDPTRANVYNETYPNWWLRDVTTSQMFCMVSDGLDSYAYANAWWGGIRPVFAICA